MERIKYFAPLIVSVVCFAAMITARLQTNRFIRDYKAKLVNDARERIKSDPDYTTMTDETLIDNFIKPIPYGVIPFTYSTVYVIGFLGLFASCFWSFWVMGWWAGAIGIGLYGVTRLVPSLVRTSCKGGSPFQSQ